MNPDETSKITKKLEDLEKKQDKILQTQKKLLKKEQEILELEKKIYATEEQNLTLHKKFDKTNFGKLFDRKRKIATKTNYKDVVKAIIGAFFGIMGHFAFAKGVDLAMDHCYLRSTLILITSFIILVLFIYYSGFRQVKKRYFLKLFPVRATVIYLSAIFTVVFVLFLYGIIDLNTPFRDVYSYVASISILAVLGAGTSDLIGAK